MQPVVLENKRFDSQQKKKTFAIIGHFNCPSISPMYATFPNKIYVTILYIRKNCWSGPGCEKFGQFFLWESDMIITENHTKMQVLAFSANQVCVAKNQTKQGALKYVLTSVIKFQLTPCLMKCDHKCLNQVFFWKHQITCTFWLHQSMKFAMRGDFERYYHWTMFCRYKIVDWNHDWRNREY